jgi:ribosome-binding protein aMBF1 (putative translation factor)
MSNSIPFSQSRQCCGGLDTLARELLDSLSEFQRSLAALVELAGRKVSAMRAADAADLYACAREEGHLLEQAGAAEQRRQAIVARLAQTLRAERLRAAPLSEIADRFAEPHASAIRARSMGLRELARELGEKNHLAASVARNLHSHLRAVLSELARANLESLGYGPTGQREEIRTHSWVDAVG